MVKRRCPTPRFLRSACAAGLAFVVPCALAACGSDSPDTGPNPTPDTGVVRDTGVPGPDTGLPGPDGGVPDTGPRPDVGTPDTGPPADAGFGPRSIIFLHTNDEHSHNNGFGPEIDDYPTPAPVGQHRIVGGLKRRAKALGDLRADAQNNTRGPVAVVSAGDMTVGTLFHLGDLFAGLDYNFASLLAYDVITFGNHEFEFGPGILANEVASGGIDLVQQRQKLIEIPIVASNIRFSLASATPDDSPLKAFYSARPAAMKPIRRTHVQMFGNVKVGFLGLMGLDAAFVTPFKSPVHFSLASNGTACTRDSECPGSICIPPASDAAATSGTCALNTNESDPRHFAALVADAAGAVAELRQQDVDLVVALAHVGVEDTEIEMIQAMGGTIPSMPRSEEILLALGVDGALAGQSMRGIDLIVGGHSHTVIQRPLTVPNPAMAGTNTYIVQAGSYGEWVGKIRLTQPNDHSPWAIDGEYSGLLKIDDAIDPRQLDPITTAAINAISGQLIAGIESAPAALGGGRFLFEHCHGTTFPGTGACTDVLGSSATGMLACYANRSVDLSRCGPMLSTCGNGRLDPGEQCDGTILGGETCNTLNFPSGAAGALGTLTCNTNCTFNTSGCNPDMHFPSFLEAGLNFEQIGMPVRHGSMATDLFFYRLGTTTFDVPKPVRNHESNLMNLVTDAMRFAQNNAHVSGRTQPVRIAVEANGVIRDPIQRGQTGVLTLADLFRVLPLGLSPVEGTPLYPEVDFYLAARELKGLLEVGVNQGMVSDSFWLGVSGARIEYDPRRPAFDPASDLTTGKITRILLTKPDCAIEDDLHYELTPLYDASLGAGLAAYPAATGGPNRLIHTASNLYIGLFAEQLGACPRSSTGVQSPLCRTCSTMADCPETGMRCDTAAHRCVGGPPAAFTTITHVDIHSTYTLTQELKEALGFVYYIRRRPSGGALPASYNTPVPRRLCCVPSASCPTDRVCPEPMLSGGSGC